MLSEVKQQNARLKLTHNANFSKFSGNIQTYCFLRLFAGTLPTDFLLTSCSRVRKFAKMIYCMFDESFHELFNEIYQSATMLLFKIFWVFSCVIRTSLWINPNKFLKCPLFRTWYHPEMWVVCKHSIAQRSRQTELSSSYKVKKHHSEFNLWGHSPVS